MSTTRLSPQVPSGLLWLPLSSVSCLISTSPMYCLPSGSSWNISVTVPHCFLLNPYLNLLFKACLKRARLTICSNLLLLQHKAIVKNEFPKELPSTWLWFLANFDYLRKVTFAESKDCNLKLQNLRTGKNAVIPQFFSPLSFL